LGVVDAGGLEPGVGEPGLGGDHLIGGLGLDARWLMVPPTPGVSKRTSLSGGSAMAKLA
jgi:hypothetical protein